MTLADNKTILLVEDNPDDAKLTLRAFKRGNILNPIVVARDGVEALDFLFARGSHSDMAVKPPKLGGLGVLKAIRANDRTGLIPVVILTSSKEEEDVISSYAHGANSYARKPVDFTEFMEAAKLTGLYWVMTNE